METLIAITQCNDGSFYSALVMDENGCAKGYDLMMFNGKTVKHESGDDYCRLNKLNIVEIPFDCIEEQTIWIADGFDYEISEPTTKECVVPHIVRGKQIIFQQDWDCMTEGDLYYHEIDYNIVDEHGNIIEDEKVFEDFFKSIEYNNISLEDYYTNNNLITIRFLRDEKGFSFQNDKISSAIENFELATDLKVSVSYNNDY